MSNHSVGTLIDPVLQRKMPLYNENMVPAGLSQPQNVSSFMEKQALQYRGAYFSYEPQGKDRAAFPAPWSSSKSSVVARRSPVTHLSGTDGLHNIIYKKDNNSEESHPAQQNSPAKQGFTLYTKSPGLSSPPSTASVIVRKSQAGAESVSPERPVYLAVPQAVYRHSPCCTDLCCVMGQRYSVEQGSSTLSNRAYEHTWRTGESLYSDKASDTLLQQRRLHTEALGECPKSVSMFSPGRTGTQTYSPSKLKEVFGPLSEQSHCLQPSPRAYPGLYPSHPTYEPVIYHNRSPISKYGQAAQHPGFYYSQAHVEVEKRTECQDTGFKHTEEVPVALKHPIPSPGDHYMVAPSLQGDISLPRVEALPSPSFLAGFDYPSYIVPRLNVNTSPVHASLKYPHAVHSEYINSSPPKHVHRPVASLATVHQDKSTLHSEHSSPFVRVEQSSPSTCTKKAVVTPSNTQSQNRHYPPRNSMRVGPPGVRVHMGAQRGTVHVGPPIVAPAHLGLDLRAPRHHPCQVRSYLQHPHISLTHTTLSNKSNMQKILYCPPRAVETTSSSTQWPNVPSGLRKRGMSISSPIKVTDDDDVYVVEPDHKRQKTEKRNIEIIDKDSSPPMPVINNVFSLAPYQTYLQMSRLCLGRLPQRPVHSEFREVRAQQPNENVKQQVVVSKNMESESPPVKECMNLKCLKHLDESKEPAGVRKDVGSDSPRVTVKQEQEEQTHQQSVSKCIQLKTPPAEVKVKQEGPDEPPHTCSVVSKDVHLDLPNVKPTEEKTEPQISKKENVDPTDQDSCSEMLVSPEQLKIIKKEPEETDCEPLLEIKKCESDDPDYNVDDKCSPGGECGQKKPLSKSERGTPGPNPPLALSPPPHPHSKLNFLNIPPQCLKLSTYNIILPEANLPRTVQISAKSPVQPAPKIQLQMPVRKHFFELHQSLVKLISKSVAATSEDTLRSWLSQMELSNHALGKNQKVSCLFGAKGREACLNEEMKSSLQLVLQRLNEYTSQERCPFPFVVRTGAIFLPMLVVKEVLFPSVQGALIDQVLQEHRVELRPATLSEEKTLIQMHKRACSSRLRRLMSLKHLPDVYVDVVNLLYYTCVCQQLESTSREVQKTVQFLPDSVLCAHKGLEVDNSLEAEPDESCEGPSSCRSPSMPPPSPLEDSEELPTKSLLKRRSRIKRSSRRMFLDCSSDDEAQNSSTTESVLRPSQEQSNVHHSSDGNDNSWMCPLASEELSTFPGDAGREKSNMQQNFEPSAAKQFQDKSKSCSGVILKLRRTFNRKRMSYQPVLDSDRLHFETGQSEPDLSPERSGEPLRPEVTRWRRTAAPFSHCLRPLSGYTKRKSRSLLTIKYCPYLSACHSAEQRRRWVLRSAVKRARRAMKLYYPDLVGKRIHHLYEEDDKSEVWYRGEVLRVHQAHPNPLKTVFEVRYDSEPEWKYYLELLIDYKKGWLKIEE